MSNFLRIAMRPKVYRTAFRVALFVGTILALINHGSAIFGWTMNKQDLFQIILTYMVPYSVSTYSSVKVISSNEKASSQEADKQV